MIFIRDSENSKEYWDKWIEFDESATKKSIELLKEPSNPDYLPQFIFNIASRYLQLILRCYSRGDEISELKQYFEPLLYYWELSEAEGRKVWENRVFYTRKTWKINLDTYIKCFWLTGLALILGIPDDQWQRLLNLMGNEGEDELLDRVIASRQKNRKIGTRICHPMPYQRLLDAVNAPKEEQAQMLFVFVKNWYKELKHPPPKDLPKDMPKYDHPYWYNYWSEGMEQTHPQNGFYFGYWCIEAVAAVKAFDLDDSKCQGHRNYPGDFLHPNGASTHPQRETTCIPVEPIPPPKKPGFFAKLFDKMIDAI